MLTGCAVPSSRTKHEPTGLLSCRASLKNIGTPPCPCCPPPTRLMEAAASRRLRMPTPVGCRLRLPPLRPPATPSPARCRRPLCAAACLLAVAIAFWWMGGQRHCSKPGRERRLPAEGKEGCKGRRAQLGGEGRGGPSR
jgi:hypothetical protein